MNEVSTEGIEKCKINIPLKTDQYVKMFILKSFIGD
jgi:hypothetical protein